MNLLTRSSCGRYVEFKAVNKLFTLISGKVEQVGLPDHVSHSPLLLSDWLMLVICSYLIGWIGCDCSFTVNVIGYSR